MRCARLVATSRIDPAELSLEGGHTESPVPQSLLWQVWFYD
jgi:hypothetical protein